MPFKAKLTEEQSRMIPELFQEGKSPMEIAKTLGIARSSVLYHVKKQEVESVKKEEEKELTKEDLIPTAKPAEKKQDEEKDYCNNCNENGVLTEIKTGQEYCPKCGVELNWEQ